MNAINKNKFGKIEKNIKIKEGKCIFPFKYKWKEHSECFETDKGNICATEINPKTRTLIKYGYCDKINSNSSNKIYSINKKKNKTQKKIKLKHIKSPELNITESTNILTATKVKKMNNTKIHKTHKKKYNLIENLKITSEIPIENKLMQTHKIYNSEFIDILGELAELLQGQGEIFKAKAYQKAQESIMLYKDDIIDINQLKDLKGIGSSIFLKLEEYINTGTIKELEKQRNNPINILTKVYGIGPKKAKELIDKGITTITELRENQNLLNDNQRIGLKYYEDINTKIPREEIDEYKKVFNNSFKSLALEGSKFEIVGSYRRGKTTSGDIDIIITNENNNKTIFESFLNDLISKNIIKEVLSRGKFKSLTIACLPDKSIARRIDFLYAPPDEYSFAILYFTGSKIFNTVMRQKALDKGYTLNEHGFSTMIKGVKGNKLPDYFPDERSIFDFLELKYKNPNQRIDGRAIVFKKSEESEEGEEEKKEEGEEEKKEEKEEKEEEEEKKKPLKRAITIKKKQINVLGLIEKFKQEGLSVLKTFTENELNNIIKKTNNEYYCNPNKISLMTDNQYDILIEYVLETYPDNTIAKEGHTTCDIKNEKNKVNLPYEMWSMDKIKPDTSALNKWINKYKNPNSYVISCKLDGVSGLYVTEGNKPKLYTRGDGIIGHDISHLIPYIKLPKNKGLAIRGEFIIEKNKFIEKYEKDFANPRNFVAGLINKKTLSTIDENKLSDIEFVAYEVIKPVLTPSEQVEFLQDKNIEIVRYTILNNISNQILSELLINWRSDYKYEIDGIICTHNKVYPRISGNPEHAFAFKMVLSEQVAEAKVVDVLWSPSKDGFLKPRIQIEPIILNGVKIEFATGFNAKYINDNNIGVGALVQLVRSGDVIPHIISVIQPADKPLMPSVPYEWNENHVEIMILNKLDDIIVREKNIEVFFNKIGVDKFKLGKIKKVVNAGYNTIPKILKMQVEDFESVEGFAKKSANQIYSNIQEKIQEVDLITLMTATNFARGLGEKKIKPILKQFPDILTSKMTEQEKINLIQQVKGIANNTATKFIENIPEFLKFIEETGLNNKLIQNIEDIKDNEEKYIDKEHPLFNKKIIMTGFRDKELITKIEEIGGIISSSVNKNTFIVIAKDINEDTGKIQQAKLLNIEIITPEKFIKKYFEN